MKFTRRRKDYMSEPMLPLINIIFLMLIFFMIAGTLSQTDPFPVSPPQSISDAATNQDEHVLLIGVAGRLAFNGEVIQRNTLQDQLQDWRAKNPGRLLRVKSDLAVDSVDLIAVLEDARAAGLDRLELLTVKSEPGDAR